MTVEVACGNCEGRLLVQDFGVVVACPHCGSHLSVPAPSDESTESTESIESPDRQPSSEASAAASASDSSSPATPLVSTETTETAEATESPGSETPADEHQAEVNQTDGNQTDGNRPGDASQPDAAPSTVPPFFSEPTDDEPGEFSFPVLQEPKQQSASTDDNPTEKAASEVRDAETEDESATKTAGDEQPWFPGPDSRADSDADSGTSDVPDFSKFQFDSQSDEEAGESVFPSFEQPHSSGSGIGGSSSAVAIPIAAPAETASPSGESVNSETTESASAEPAIVATPIEGTTSKVEVSTLSAAQHSPGKSVSVKGARSATSEENGISRTKFLIVLSYASAVTLGLIYLIFQMKTADPHQLESLPDLAPPKEGQFQHVRPEAAMAPGHTLQIGEARRFGNVEVTPLRVTRGPLQFSHYSGDASRSRPSTEPVVKLWLRFKNVSADQQFSPLDLELMMARQTNPKDPARIYANHFVCRTEEKRAGGELVYVYDHPPTSEFNLLGLKAGQSLKPGESCDIFIPTTEEGLEALSGSLIWRVHFRKGFHPKSMNGVTTLVEVEFDSEAIQDERQT